MLVIADGGQRFVLRQGRSLVGRASDCDIVIDHTSVSRVHAALLSPVICREPALPAST